VAIVLAGTRLPTVTQTLPTRCLILACGNTLRGDDGVGLWLANWSQNRFCADPAVRTVSRQQWAPELAEDIARSSSVLFIDCSITAPPGAIQLVPVAPAASCPSPTTHHLGAPQLLAIAHELYGQLPHAAFLLTIGAGATALGEEFSEPVKAAFPQACKLIEDVVQQVIL
jgi:hydrogenase maturation protease